MGVLPLLRFGLLIELVGYDGWIFDIQPFGDIWSGNEVKQQFYIIKMKPGNYAKWLQYLNYNE